MEHHDPDGAPLGVGRSRPRLSWRTETNRGGWHQAAWEVDAVDHTGARLWRSGRVDGGDAVLVPWGGEPLASRTRCAWRVRVWGDDGSASEWSGLARFEIGLLSPADWSAVAIAPAWDEDASTAQPCPHLRRRFDVVQTVTRARLHVTALGVYEADLNGTRVGDHVLAPGWTTYHSRLHVQTYDVTDLVRAGSNELTTVVGDGWYRGNLGFAGNRNVYGERTAVLAQLELDLADGARQVIATDGSWEAATGPILAADLYDGERYDARRAPSAWSPVTVVDLDRSTLVPQSTPPVRVTEVVVPVAVTTSPSGRTIVDFGQNLVGVARIRVSGRAGTTVTLRHAEVLEDGELCTRILRAAKATDSYTLRGGGVEEWHPRFTFHGFRYVEVTGWPGVLGISDIDALVVHSDLRRTGWFECSHDLVNRLHENIVWGWRGNTVSVPTDCPQRDERLGWTGDLQVFAPTAAFLYDAAAFLAGWLRDLTADQLPDGRVPAVVPDVLQQMPAYAAGWGDASTVVPSVVHEWYGDEGVLADQVDSMRAWVDSIRARARDGLLWVGEFQFGDWVDPTVDPHTPGSARTDPGFVATAYYARSADLVSRAAWVLDQTDIAESYGALAASVRDALQHEWMAPSGRVVADTQTGCALALVFDLVPAAARPVVAARLRELVRAERFRLSTGFLGTPVVLDALRDGGNVRDAYRLLLQTAPPSWLYPVTMGATTIWERWDGLRPDGSLNPAAEMLSFNHYALGAAGAWLHSTVGGLQALAPGFRRFRVAPVPGVGVRWARLAYDSAYGRIESSWSLDADAGTVALRVVVPPNTDAEVVIPGRDETHHVGSGVHEWHAEVDPVALRWVLPQRAER